jgi:hypothetical protein
MFNSIEEFKKKSEFIKKGKIIPTRILQCSKRKKQHCLKANADIWAIPTPSGYLVLVDGYCGFAIINNVHDVILTGSPYTKNGHVHFIGYVENDKDKKCLLNLNKYAAMQPVNSAR